RGSRERRSCRLPEVVIPAGSQRASLFPRARGGAKTEPAEDAGRSLWWCQRRARGRRLGEGLQHRLRLRGGEEGHLAFSRISTRRQRLVRESGRVSTTRPRSPSPASLRASCACRVRERRTIFSYCG